MADEDDEGTDAPEDAEFRESSFPEDDDPEAGRRRRLEGLIRDGLRGVLERGLERGIGTLNKGEKAIKSVVGGELPRELVGYAFSQVDETKNALVRVVAGEVRDFLQATDLAQELQKALTSLSFEIKTEIRFIPNDAGTVKPDVRARVRPRRGKRSDEDDAAPEPGERER